MNELIQEIQEDIRREQLDRLWKRFGGLMVGASVAVVIATAAYQGWQSHKQSQEEAQTARLVKGIDQFNDKDYKSAISTFTALSDDPNASYYGIAMLRKAEAQDAGGDKEGAAETYAALAKRDTVYGQLAAVLVAKDARPPAPANKASPFYFTQSERADWELLKQGKTKEAVAGFTALRDSADMPFTMRQRIQEALQYIAPEKPASDKGTAHE